MSNDEKEGGFISHLAELRKKEKLMANNWEIILQLQVNPLEMKKLQDDNEKYCIY